ARLPPVRRALVRRAITEAREGVRERERTKSLAVAMVDAGRRLARAAGARLFAEQRVDRPDDVLFLTADELAAALAGAAPSRPQLRRRRRRYERAALVPAPRLIDLRSGADPPEPATWRGTGVSAGVGMGPARVVAAGEPMRLEPGEVLVAPVLDAALGPLLASAAGAVAEIGGMLSHGAVVARELGVPCVVDVREATTRIRTGDPVLVDGSTGEVRPWEAPVGETGPIPGLDLLARASAADEAFHVLEPHPLARESVYVNVQDPEARLVLVASLGARPRGNGEALVALGLPDGRVLFALELAPLQRGPSGVSVGAMESRWAPVRLRFDGRLSSHEADGFPPGPLPLVLAPRTVEARIDLSFVPTTPAIDFTQGLPEAEREALRPVGAHHVEQSGRWQGWVEVDGRQYDVEGTGSRDHSWGRRDWEAAEWWRLFTARFGDDLAVHALAVSAGGRVVEGGFVWRHGEVERIRRVAFAARRGPFGLSGLDLELGTARGPLYLTGQVERTLTVPVQLARSLGRQLSGRPWRLLLHENYTRYTCAGREGRGMAEITERP
ncbi:MAG: hypothetical protein DMF78_11740, partial [Acidobacteria bacterium]